MVEAADAEFYVNPDKSRDLPGYRYYVIDEPRRATAYELRAAMLEKRSHAAPDAVVFENMPMIVPLSNEPADTFLPTGIAMEHDANSGSMARVSRPGTLLSRAPGQFVLAVIDSGCDLTHPDIFFVPGAGGPNGNGANNPGLSGFAAGHGTMCAGVATTHNLKVSPASLAITAVLPAVCLYLFH